MALKCLNYTHVGTIILVYLWCFWRIILLIRATLDDPTSFSPNDSLSVPRDVLGDTYLTNSSPPFLPTDQKQNIGPPHYIPDKVFKYGDPEICLQ